MALSAHTIPQEFYAEHEYLHRQTKCPADKRVRVMSIGKGASRAGCAKVRLWQKPPFDELFRNDGFVPNQAIPTRVSRHERAVEVGKAEWACECRLLGHRVYSPARRGAFRRCSR